MNVYVYELACALGTLGMSVDIYTRAFTTATAGVVHLGTRVRVISLHIGPTGECDKYDLLPFIPNLAQAIDDFSNNECAIYDLIHSNYWISGAVALDLARRWTVPIIHMSHTLGAMKNLVAQAGEVEHTSRLHIEQELFSQADGIVAATARDALEMQTHYVTAAERVHIIPCGVDVSHFSPRVRGMARQHLGLEAYHKIILFVGRIEPLKGIDTLIRATHHQLEVQPHLRKLLRVLIVGEESEQTSHQWPQEQCRLRDLRDELGLQQNIIFVGSQAQHDLPNYYGAADMVAIPSRYESFGLVALEAMACGVPVVAANVGGLSCTVQHGVNGLLYPTYDHLSLSYCMNEILTDVALRTTIGANALTTAQDYSWCSIGQKIRRLCEEIVTQRCILSFHAQRRSPLKTEVIRGFMVNMYQELQ